jgi:putative membrane protein
MLGDPLEGPARFEPKPTAESHFSWLRTRMSTERTLMSWVRTGVSLIGFGFTIFQVAARLPGTTSAHLLFPEAPRYLGLGLIGGGTLGLIIVAWQYRWMTRYLNRPEFGPVAGVSGGPHHTPTLAITLLLIVVGLFAFTAVLLRLP